MFLPQNAEKTNPYIISSSVLFIVTSVTTCLLSLRTFAVMCSGELIWQLGKTRRLWSGPN